LDHLYDYTGTKLCDICKEKTAQKESQKWIPPTTMNESYNTTYYCNECYQESVRKNDQDVKESLIKVMEEAVKKSDDPESMKKVLKQYKQYKSQK
jgi:uncharacterized Zn finger protein (UPF0148 family)